MQHFRDAFHWAKSHSCQCLLTSTWSLMVRCWPTAGWHNRRSGAHWMWQIKINTVCHVGGCRCSGLGDCFLSHLEWRRSGCLGVTAAHGVREKSVILVISVVIAPLLCLLPRSQDKRPNLLDEPRCEWKPSGETNVEQRCSVRVRNVILT